MTATYTDYRTIQKTARDAAVKAHIAGKTVRDLVLDPVVTFTAETPKEKAHAFRYTVDGQTYTARTVLGWYARCPGVGEAVRVYYAPDRPERCALRSEDFLRL